MRAIEPGGRPVADDVRIPYRPRELAAPDPLVEARVPDYLREAVTAVAPQRRPSPSELVRAFLELRGERVTKVRAACRTNDGGRLLALVDGALLDIDLKERSLRRQVAPKAWRQAVSVSLHAIAAQGR